MSKGLTTAQARELLGSLRLMLGAGDDDVAMSQAMRHRIEGAIAALETILGEKTSLLDRFETDE